MNFNNFSHKEKIGLSIGIIFMSFALIDRTIINSINSRIRQIDKQIKVSEKELALEILNVSQKVPLVEENNKYVKKSDIGASDEEQFASMLTTVEDLGREAGISLLDIKPQPVKKMDPIKQYNVSLEAEGDMKSLVNFMYKVNNSPDVLRVESLQMNLKDKESTSLKITIQISKIVLS